ncbi:PepSY-associated TM helix domain-containing protein [Taibaiella chishuiensis]|uniref:Putative iron-regulated membrane protein n=1 Tax=Taibaiella chishuiensis TaxID=1434707 RepID=A0A2P8CXZ2_9BACT|nr:PepSY-associated TM helix domain-containing protein [Taibaiella chishuiensis]PSK89835.1 putative iron-regulated membrane protein [Taibaiella chishuiensis]
MKTAAVAAKKKTKSPFKKVVSWLHLWLGLTSGLIVCFLGLTGCILAFEREIEDATQHYRFVETRKTPLMAPSELETIALKQLPDKKLHSVSYEPGKASVAVFYNAEPQYYYLVFLDPYTGKVLKVRDMSQDFFRFIIDGHFYLWLPPAIGQPIVASATLIFVVMIITGIILWWPRNKAARKQRFSVKFNAKWRRTNYDLHNVLGFYMSWVIIFIAFTGLVWGFQWFAKTVYWTTSGGKEAIAFEETLSDTSSMQRRSTLPAIDQVWLNMRQEQPAFAGLMEVHIPESKASSIEIALNPDSRTYWKADYRYFDQYSFKELSVKHAFGRLQDTKVADKLVRMNYDIHVGAIAGLPGKILAFCASLICASLPVTGFLIWRGRRKKSKKGNAVPAKTREVTAA